MMVMVGGDVDGDVGGDDDMLTMRMMMTMMTMMLMVMMPIDVVGAFALPRWFM